MRITAFLTVLVFSSTAWANSNVLEQSDLDPVNQALQELQAPQEDLAKRMVELKLKGSTPPEPTTNPYADMAENSWRHVGPAISSVWADLDPPLDPLTRGASGLAAIVNQWCGAGWNADSKSFTRACGGHRSTGYNRAYRYSVRDLTIEWASPDVRLNHPDLTNACPYPSELGVQAGPAANHWYDGIVTTPDGNTYFFPETAYDCKGLKNREPARVWRLSPAGEWSIAHDSLPINVNATATATLPDGKILTLSRYYQAIFDPAAGEYVMHDSYAELGGFGNLIAAGEAEPGVLRFLWFDYHQGLSQILVRKNDAGEWSVGWPKKLADKVAWYTAGAVWLPDQEALMIWGGGQSVKFVLLDTGTPEIRVMKYEDIRDPGGRKFMIHDGGMQYLPDWGVVVTLGPGSGDGIHVYRPPSDLRAATKPAPPPREDLQRLIDAAAPGDTINITGRFNGARIKKKGLTINCGPGTSIGGPLTNGQGNLLIEATPFAISGSCEFVGERLRRPKGTAAIFMAVAGDYSVDGALFKWNANGILTSSRGWIGDINLTVTNSSFVDNGYPGSTPGHQIYYGNGGGTSDGEPSRLLSDDPTRWANTHMHGGTLLIEDSTFTGQTNGGHGVKSGAQTTIIRRSTIEQGLAGLSYRPVDNYAGGVLVLEDVKVHLKFDPTEAGLASEQTELVAFAPEVWGPNFRGHMPATDSISVKRMTGTCEGHAPYINFKVVKSWRDVVPVWSGATAEDPDGDSSFTGCGALYVRSE